MDTNHIHKAPDCFIPESYNPYPCCEGRGFLHCEDCCLFKNMFDFIDPTDPDPRPEYNRCYGDILERVSDDNLSVIVVNLVDCAAPEDFSGDIRARFPEVYELYQEKRESADSPEELLGDVQYISCLDDAGYIISNAFGLNSCDADCPLDMDVLRKVFRDIRGGFPASIIRIPYKFGLGDGLSYEEWRRCVRVINEELTWEGVRVEVWAQEDFKKE